MQPRHHREDSQADEAGRVSRTGALIGVGLAIGATQIVTGIQFLAAVLRRNRRP
jgi:hypothetical protein